MMLIYEVYINISLCLTLKIEISLLLGRERSEFEIGCFQMFRANKRTKHARARFQVWKNGGNIVDRVHKKSYEFKMLSKFSNIKEQHFKVTNLKMVYSFLGESIVFQTKLTWGRFPNSLFSHARYTKNFGAKTHFFQSLLYILPPYKQTTEHISNRVSQQARRALFS